MVFQKMDTFITLASHLNNLSFNFNKIRIAKHSFLRELREVAPEMELFREFCDKVARLTKFSARHFTKLFVCILKNMTGKWFATFF